MTNPWELEIVVIDSNGVRAGVELTSEHRGNDEDYDPWLRQPIKNVIIEAKRIANLYDVNLAEFIEEINKGGINHINRQLLSIMWERLKDEKFNEFYETTESSCTEKVRILVKQYYAHRLYKTDNAKCLEVILQSIDLVKQMPNRSWDKWLVSGYFFAARYDANRENKIKYCIAAIMEPFDIVKLSPHLKFWKLFRAAAWLVGNGIDTEEAKAAVARFLSLEFRGYTEYNGSPTSNDNYTCDIFGKSGKQEDCILYHPKACLELMTDKVTNIYGNP